jgi:lipoprotein NlpD
MGKPLMILRRTIVCTLVVGYLSGCGGTNSAPIQSATLSSGNRAANSNNVSTINSGMDNSTVDSSLSGNSGGWVPNPPSNISTQDGSAAPSQASAAAINTSPTVNAATNGGAVVAGSAVPNRNYSDIPKGSFAGDRYTVARGDTLFYIAWISGNDYRELAAKNNISEPYNLTVGQVLDVGNGTSVNSGTTLTANRTNSSNNSKSSSSQSNKNVDKMLPQTTPSTSSASTTPAATTSTGTVSTNVSKINWRWPTNGKVIDGFSASEGGNKGVDIAGAKGQSVSSAADGRVVYAGNALRGYGNLIIIKHNDDYLSAYAHNDTMLVSEQQEVKAGQQIATMGSTGASSVRLHFEVRYKGKSVNPLQYLPQR